METRHWKRYPHTRGSYTEESADEFEQCGVTQHSTIVLRLGRSGTTKADRVKKSGTGDQRYVGPSSATDPNPQVDFVIQVRNVSVNYEQRFWNIFGHDSTPVERLKFAIEKLSGIKQERQRLVLGGSELKDDQQTIGEVSNGVRSLTMNCY